MVSNGFKIIGVETEKKFNEGDLPKVEYDNVTLSFAPAKADHLKSWATASQLKGKAIRLLGKSQLFASGVLTCTY